jgi:hypothetical protein
MSLNLIMLSLIIAFATLFEKWDWAEFRSSRYRVKSGFNVPLLSASTQDAFPTGMF